MLLQSGVARERDVVEVSVRRVRGAGAEAFDVGAALGATVGIGELEQKALMSYSTARDCTNSTK